MLEDFVDLEADVVKFAPEIYVSRCSSSIEFLKMHLEKNKTEYTLGYMEYLFQCLHCKKYRLF